MTMPADTAPAWPDLAEAIEWSLAPHFSQNRMPHMSGDPRARLGTHERRAMEGARDGVLALLQAREAAAWAAGAAAMREAAAMRGEAVAMPMPDTADAVFLGTILAAAQAGERVTAEDVARLRQLADWADAAPPPHWDGRLDRQETQRAVAAAHARLNPPAAGSSPTD